MKELKAVKAAIRFLKEGKHLHSKRPNTDWQTKQVSCNLRTLLKKRQKRDNQSTRWMFLRALWRHAWFFGYGLLLECERSWLSKFPSLLLLSINISPLLTLLLPSSHTNSLNTHAVSPFLPCFQYVFWVLNSPTPLFLCITLSDFM